MAYNRKNHLFKVIDIQETTLKHTACGVTQEFIFTNYIHPIYHISKATYYKYLGMNAKRELKKLLIDN